MIHFDETAGVYEAFADASHDGEYLGAFDSYAEARKAIADYWFWSKDGGAAILKALPGGEG